MKERLKVWIEKNQLKDKFSALGSKPFAIIPFVIVAEWYGLIADKPEIKNTTLFIFMFFSALFLLINYYKKINPFKNKKSSNYVYSLICVGYLVGDFLDYVVWQGLYALGINDTLNQQLLDEVARNSPNEKLQIDITTSILAPIGEEIIFRGVLLCLILFVGNAFRVERKKGYIVFIVVSSLLFGVGHAFDSWLTTIPYILSGVIYSIAYLYSKSIIVPIGMHVLNNGIIAISEGKDVNVTLAMICLTIVVVGVEVMQNNTNKKFLERKKVVRSKIENVFFGKKKVKEGEEP